MTLNMDAKKMIDTFDYIKIKYFYIERRKIKDKWPNKNRKTMI